MFVCVFVCVYVCAFMCAFMCVREREVESVCVCARARVGMCACVHAYASTNAGTFGLQFHIRCTFHVCLHVACISVYMSV